MPNLINITIKIKTKEIIDGYHYFERAWSILRVIGLESHDIRPWDFNLILQTTIKNFPHQLMLCKVTLRHQVSFISRLVLHKAPHAHQSQYHIMFLCIVLIILHAKFQAYLPSPNFQNGSRKIGGLQFRIHRGRGSRSLLIFLLGLLLLGEPHLNQIQK